jgi:hypothetical protein
VDSHYFGQTAAYHERVIDLLSADDIGHRVVVRRIVGERDGRPLLSDLLGDLTEFGPDGLVVATTAGPVRVPLKEVVAGKQIPPQPPRRASRRAEP